MTEALKQWIADYDSRKAMESVDMGGMGEGYEATIQECAIEIMRHLQDISIPEDKEERIAAIEKAGNAAVAKLNEVHGFSGAQVGAAKNLASVFWIQTPEKGIAMMKEQNPERVISIRKGKNDKVCFAQK